MNIFDNKLGRYLFKTVTKYRMGFCLEKGGIYVAYNAEKNKFGTTERYVLVTRDTELMLNGELTSKINKIKINESKLPRIKWIEGVPGSGKTWYIVSDHKSGRDLILSQTRAGVKDIRETVAKQFSDSKESLRLYENYRTVASYIINHKSRVYDRVYIDEGLLMHAGYIGFVAILSGATEIVVVGDSKQIPYIERTNSKTNWSKLSNFCDPAENIDKTRRCPVDVCYALSCYYENIITSSKIKSVWPTIKNCQFYQLESDTLILTFTQKEKRILIDTLYRFRLTGINILTVHEAQGQTSKNVLLVRLDSRSKEIYNSEPHAVVALSRHTNSFRYLTTGEDDAVEKLIKRLDCTTEEELKQWNLNRISGKTKIN